MLCLIYLKVNERLDRSYMKFCQGLMTQEIKVQGLAFLIATHQLIKLDICAKFYRLPMPLASLAADANKSHTLTVKQRRGLS